VFLATTTLELVVQFTPQLEQPAIMVMGCASPDGARVVEVSDFVDIISPHTASHTVSSGHKLCVLDDHLGAVLVTVVLGTFLWITIKEEDVHGYIVAGDLLMSRIDELKCWPGYRRVRGKVPGSKGSCKRIGESIYDRIGKLLTEAPHVDAQGKPVTVRMKPISRKMAGKSHTAKKAILQAVAQNDRTIKRIDRSPANVDASGAVRTYQKKIGRALRQSGGHGRNSIDKGGQDYEIVEDLRKWVKERWVDIGAPKKGGGFKPCGRSKGEKRSGYPKCVPAAKASRMSKGQRKSAVRRKRAAGNPGGKPTMVSTFKKK
jgi:hypothetical protein